MKHNFTYGNHSYEYYIEFSNRKTMGLIVQPDLRIIAKIPYGTSLDEIEAFLGRKWLWLHKTLSDFKRYKKKHYILEYISGESFQYLGRRYMLSVEHGAKNSVNLERSRLKVLTTKDTRLTEHNKKLVENWYEHRREIVFKKLFLQSLKLFKYDEAPVLQQRSMARRWGSYRQGKIFLNPRLIEAPTEAIQYVIVHELCHVTNRSHDVEFYRELEKRIPNWREIKDRLEIRYG